MKYKAKKTPSSITTRLTFETPALAGFALIVRYLGAAQERSLSERATRNGRIDLDALAIHYADACVASWEGLTLDVLNAMVEIETDAPLPPAQDGEIPYDRELCGFLLRNARVATLGGVDLLENVVLRTARAVLLAEALEKKRSSEPSSDD